jgi:hypothetical protein
VEEVGVDTLQRTGAPHQSFDDVRQPGVARYSIQNDAHPIEEGGGESAVRLLHGRTQTSAPRYWNFPRAFTSSQWRWCWKRMRNASVRWRVTLTSHG